MNRFPIALVAAFFVSIAAALAGLHCLPVHASTPELFQDAPASVEQSTNKPASSLLNPKSGSLFVKMFEGSAVGIGIVILILLLSILSVFFVIEHALSINRRKLMPNHVIADLETHIARGEINQALEMCYQSDNYSLVTEVVAAGLERFQSSEFGFAEYRTAVEEAGEDFTGRLYRKTEVLNVIGSIAPMLGLLGTVVGMIEAFNTIAAREGMARPEELAGGIGQALITTLLGLFVAIPTMVAFSFFRNKIDSLVAEAGKRIERMMLPLGRKR